MKNALKHNKTQCVLIAATIIIIIVAISLSLYNRIKNSAESIEMCAIDFGVLIIGKGILTEVINPLLIVSLFMYAWQNSRNFQAIIRKKSRVQVIYDILIKVSIAGALLCAFTQFIAMLAGMIVTGRVCNWEMSNSMFADEMFMTGLSINNIPNAVAVSCKSFILAYTNCVYRCMAGIIVGLLTERGVLSVVALFFMELIVPHRLVNDFAIKYKLTGGNYYGELVYNSTYIRLLLCNIILLIAIAIIAMLVVRRKDYVK